MTVVQSRRIAKTEISSDFTVVILHIFNPENDLALADGGANYCPPPAAAQIAYDLGSLPLWFADKNDVVLLPDASHDRYCTLLSSTFNLAVPYCDDLKHGITVLRPWGWSPQMKRRLKAMGFAKELLPTDEEISKLRALSNRKTAFLVLKTLKERGIDTPELPLYLTSTDDVAAFVESIPRSVVKAPWSGSGKGIMWGLGRVEVPLENFYKGVIKRQGGVVCEHFLDSVQEFAMEFLAAEGGVHFAGYSLFESEKGGYSGNLLAPDEDLERIISQHIPLDVIRSVRLNLLDILSSLLQGSGYNGYLGVDMMIYHDAEGRMRLNPCMEVNLRMNMGVAARIIYDRHVLPGKQGRFQVRFYKKQGEAYNEHMSRAGEYPAVYENGRIASGYVNLSPVTMESRYLACMIVDV